MSFTYEIEDEFIYTGFTASVYRTESTDTENFEPQNMIGAMPWFWAVLANPTFAYPVYTLTGISEYVPNFDKKIREKSEGYTKLRQTGVLRDLPPNDDYGFLSVDNHFAQTSQRIAVNYDLDANPLTNIDVPVVNDIVGPNENLTDFYEIYCTTLPFTTIFSRVETFAYYEPREIALGEDNVFEILSLNILQPLKIGDGIMDSQFNFVDTPEVVDNRKQSKFMPYIYPNEIGNIDDTHAHNGGGTINSVKTTGFNHYFTTYEDEYAHLQRHFKTYLTVHNQFYEHMGRIMKEYDSVFQTLKDLEKAYRVKVQVSPKFDMKKLSLYDTMEDATSATPSADAPMTTPMGGGGGSSY
tara:strand:+ start:10263 stop:11324 length:1062 start_codon:yes stop_codon:yes gene_type:complete